MISCVAILPCQYQSQLFVFTKSVQLPALPPLGTTMFFDDETGHLLGQNLEKVFWNETHPHIFELEMETITIDSDPEDFIEWIKELGWDQE